LGAVSKKRSLILKYFTQNISYIFLFSNFHISIFVDSHSSHFISFNLSLTICQTKSFISKFSLCIQVWFKGNYHTFSLPFSNHVSILHLYPLGSFSSNQNIDKYILSFPLFSNFLQIRPLPNKRSWVSLWAQVPDLTRVLLSGD